ncbi:F-box protein-like [Forsythia ovata]|uniref:F-box protein-like n=1 Tax=Forsythia ovata TaxID=205694 RepID=A0ABD1SA62_9LAMI
MQLPDDLSNELPVNLNAAVFEESLAIFQFDARVWSKSCSIWVMKEYGVPESWSKQFYVDLIEGLGMVLGFRKNGHVLLSDRNGDLISHNPGTGAREDLGIVGTKDSFYVDTYVETLALFIEGKEARARLPSDSDSEYDSSEADVEDEYGDVDKSEIRMQSTIKAFAANGFTEFTPFTTLKASLSAMSTGNPPSRAKISPPLSTWGSASLAEKVPFKHFAQAATPVLQSQRQSGPYQSKSSLCLPLCLPAMPLYSNK